MIRIWSGLSLFALIFYPLKLKTNFKSSICFQGTKDFNMIEEKRNWKLNRKADMTNLQENRSYSAYRQGGRHTPSQSNPWKSYSLRNEMTDLMKVWRLAELDIIPETLIWEQRLIKIEDVHC